MNGSEFKRVWKVIEGMDLKLDSVMTESAGNAVNITWIIRIQVLLLALIMFLLTGKFFLGLM